MSTRIRSAICPLDAHLTPFADDSWNPKGHATTVTWGWLPHWELRFPFEFGSRQRFYPAHSEPLQTLDKRQGLFELRELLFIGLEVGGVDTSAEAAHSDGVL